MNTINKNGRWFQVRAYWGEHNSVKFEVVSDGAHISEGFTSAAAARAHVATL